MATPGRVSKACRRLTLGRVPHGTAGPRRGCRGPRTDNAARAVAAAHHQGLADLRAAHRAASRQPRDSRTARPGSGGGQSENISRIRPPTIECLSLTSSWVWQGKETASRSSKPATTWRAATRTTCSIARSLCSSEAWEEAPGCFATLLRRISFGVWLKEQRSPTSLERKRWPCLSAHLGAGLRLRAAARGLHLDAEPVEAVLDSCGKVHDARLASHQPFGTRVVASRQCAASRKRALRRGGAIPMRRWKAGRAWWMDAGRWWTVSTPTVNVSSSP